MFKKLLLIYLIFLFLYYPVFGSYFSQDDFFHFKVALEYPTSFFGFLKMFGFYGFSERGVAFYRPLFREVLYNFNYFLFGLNSFPFRLLQVFLHLVNCYLVWVLMEGLFKLRRAWMVVFMFAIGAANVGALYYLAGGIQAQGALFFVLLMALALHRKKVLAGFIFYLLALCSHEMAALSGLVLAFGVFLLQGNGMSKKKFVYILGWIVTMILYLIIDFWVIGTSSGEVQYRPVFEIGRTINTLAWYLAWSMGLPEMTVDFVRSGLKLDPRLMQFWGRYYLILFPMFFVIICGIAVRVGYLLSRGRSKLQERRLWLMVMVFLAGILPVIFLPWHKKTYYLYLSLPFFWGSIFYLFQNVNKKIVGLFIVLLFIFNTVSLQLAGKTYWAINRAKLAKSLMVQMQSVYPTLPKGAVVFVRNDPNYQVFSLEWGNTSKQAYFALSGEDAFNLYYKDMTLRVYYEDLLDGNSVPEGALEFTAFVD